MGLHVDDKSTEGSDADRTVIERFCHGASIF